MSRIQIRARLFETREAFRLESSEKAVMTWESSVPVFRHTYNYVSYAYNAYIMHISSYIYIYVCIVNARVSTWYMVDLHLRSAMS